MNNSEIIDIIAGFTRINLAFKDTFFIKYNYDGYINTAAFYKKSWRTPKSKYTPIRAKIANYAERNLSNQEIVSTVFTDINIEFGNESTEEVNIAIQEFIKEYITFMSEGDIPRQKGTYLHKENVKIIEILSLFKYIEYLTEYRVNDNHEMYFRGQTDSNYILLPSILRSTCYYNKEQYFYNAITRLCPKDFDSLKTHIDKLVEMQHYELPTRLLDISRNALVALLFSCLEGKNDGEVILFMTEKNAVKYGQSDTLSILSCLPSLSTEQKTELIEEVNYYSSIIKREREKTSIDVELIKKNIISFNEKPIVQHLLHEIKTEKPAFKEIIDPGDIQKIIFALPALHNNRIIRQSGAFIITGLYDFSERLVVSNKLNLLRVKNKGLTPVFVINSKAKEEILQELELCDLNEATLFPEIDRVARYLKSQM